MATFEAMASLDPSLLLSRCCHSYRICLNPATKVIPFAHYAMGEVAPWRRMRRDPIFVGAALAGSPEVANCLSPSLRRTTMKAVYGKLSTLSSEERLLLDPTGEGEDILNGE
ncbi:hypothetical protein V8E54_009745 [Elaphomyces granulatus]